MVDVREEGTRNGHVVESVGVHGKGKVRERRRPAATVAGTERGARVDGADVPHSQASAANARQRQQTALRLDMLPHSDLEGGEKADDPPRRFPDDVLFTHVDARGADGDGQYTDKVLRINFDSPAGAQEGMRIIRKGKVPIVMRRTPFLTSLVAAWDFNHMCVAFRGRKNAFRVMCADALTNKFIVTNDAKNIFGSYYHIREPETQKMKMGMADFVGCLRSWTSNSVMLYEELMHADDGQDDDDEKRREDAGATSPTPEMRTTTPSRCPEISPHVPEQAAEELRTLPRWEWMHSFLLSGRFGPISGVDLRCTSRDALQPLHYDTREQIICQVAGRARVLLIPPESSFEGVYPFPVHHPYDCYSMVDFDDADLGKWPKLVRVRGMMCVLEPGDLLHVPRCWWRQIHTLSDEATSLTLSTAIGGRIRTPGMVHPALGRILEERVAEAEGVLHARHWLEVIARGRELDAIDLGTVKGLRRLDMAQMVRDEIEHNIGKGRWSDFLDSLISGRLSQTPWLNQNFREPLYLQDKPVRIDDTRSEIEKQFPEFFREKLERDGYKVEKTVSTVPIPGVNVPMDYGK